MLHPCHGRSRHLSKSSDVQNVSGSGNFSYLLQSAKHGHMENYKVMLDFSDLLFCMVCTNFRNSNNNNNKKHFRSQIQFFIWLRNNTMSLWPHREPSTQSKTILRSHLAPIFCWNNSGWCCQLCFRAKTGFFFSFFCKALDLSATNLVWMSRVCECVKVRYLCIFVRQKDEPRET